MEKINGLQNKISELRELINSSICYKQGAWDRKENGDWSKLWTAVDNIEDTQLATKEFTSLQNFSRLAIYGLLQSLVVQQDGLRHLEEAIKIKVPNFKTKYPELYRIRKIRNETIGHPTETKRKNGVITYTSISPTNNLNTLEYGVWSKDGFTHRAINLKDIINTQQRLLTGEINKVIKKIKKDEIKHKRKYRNESLTSLLSQSDYFIQKLWSFEKQRDYSKINFDILKSCYNKFKDGIKKRYNIQKMDDGIQIPGLIMVTQKVDKLLPIIEKMIPIGANVDEFNLDVYVESLNKSFKELRGMAKEIDAEFGTK